MLLLVATSWACEPEACLVEAAEARRELRLHDAAALLDSACQGGSAEGCARLAFARFFGNGVERDEQGALLELVAACEAGSTYACAARRFLDEDEDQVATEPWYREQCEAGEPYACYALGWSVMKRDSAIGGSWLVQACEAGVGAACTSLGTLYLRGEGLPRDEDKALAYFGRGCESGSITGCLYVETMGPAFHAPRVQALCEGGMEEACYELGRRAALESDFEEAVSWHQRACDLGHTKGCAQVGLMMISDLPEPDPEGGIALLRDTCEQEEGLACGVLAWLMDSGAVAGEPGESLALAERGCELGDSWACFHRSVQVLPQDREAGLESLDRACGLGMVEACGRAAFEEPTPERVETACVAGDPWACNIQGMALLALGDSEGAFALLSEHCVEGTEPSCFSQALIWMDARSVPYDPVAGATRMGELCAAGNGDGCAMYGVALLEGDGLLRDHSKALEAFQRACDLEASTGCRMLGMAYDAGIGTKKSRRKARKAYARACALGDAESC